MKFFAEFRKLFVLIVLTVFFSFEGKATSQIDATSAESEGSSPTCSEVEACEEKCKEFQKKNGYAMRKCTQASESCSAGALSWVAPVFGLHNICQSLSEKCEQASADAVAAYAEYLACLPQPEGDD